MYLHLYVSVACTSASEWKSKSATESKSVSKSKSEPNSKSKPSSKSDPNSKSESESKSGSNSKSKSRSKSGSNSTSKSRSKSGSNSKSKPRSKPVSRRASISFRRRVPVSRAMASAKIQIWRLSCTGCGTGGGLKGGRGKSRVPGIPKHSRSHGIPGGHSFALKSQGSRGRWVGAIVVAVTSRREEGGGKGRRNGLLFPGFLNFISTFVSRWKQSTVLFFIFILSFSIYNAE